MTCVCSDENPDILLSIVILIQFFSLNEEGGRKEPALDHYRRMKNQCYQGQRFNYSISFSCLRATLVDFYFFLFVEKKVGWTVKNKYKESFEISSKGW